jgi:chorismate mutase/prephenate dehydrogenase
MSDSNQVPSNRDPRALLEQHRRDIEALDRRVLHLVCERLELARQVGNLKSELGIPLRNFEIEAQVHQRFAEASRYLGLDPGLGRALGLFLIEKAVEEQASQRDTRYAGDALSTLVVGGKGGMGSWIARFLAGQGHRVSVFDPAPGSTPFVEPATLAEGADGVDLIMVAVPMSACGAILEELAAVGSRAVVAEMCSLKGHLRPAMERVRSLGMRLVSFHPLFGPDVRMLSDRTVVFCTDARRDDLALVEGLFERTSARLVEMDVDEHDRRMGLVLGLTHLVNLVFGRALASSDVSAAELVEVAGVTFHKQLATTREVASENPELYYEIQALNQTAPEGVALLERSLAEWGEVIAKADRTRFEELMVECREHLAGPQWTR